MNFTVKVGDVLDEPADVLICPANPWLNLSGGVNGALLLRGGAAVQAELRNHLRSIGRPAVEPGTVVRTGPGPLSAKHIVHAVAIDPFYGSSVNLVRQALEGALRMAQSLDTVTVATPMLATGYGPLTAEHFADALAGIQGRDWSPIAELVVVVRRTEDAEVLKKGLLG